VFNSFCNLYLIRGRRHSADSWWLCRYDYETGQLTQCSRQSERPCNAASLYLQLVKRNSPQNIYISPVSFCRLVNCTCRPTIWWSR
jgi:hypothetical protein